jgi:two-component system, NtrC family, nitrogen regulation response regulator NtrX
MKSVLYLGCPAAERAETEKLLGAARVSIVWADNVAYALSELNRRDMPVLLDLSRGASALQIARDLRAQRAGTLMFAVVDERRPDLTTEAVLEGMADVFARPLGGRRVANAIARELAYESRQDRPADAARGDLYTQSPSMRDVSALIARAATMRAGVLIRGEEGTGREIVARAIHGARPSPAGAFVQVDCAAFDAEQLEAALFGSQRSPHGDAFRGLQRVSRHSRLYAAQGGTLYLQNVAEAPARAQARLARLLRDREAILSETGEAVDLDVRPMAGVNTRFEHAVEEGRVRDDLLRRLSVVHIDMPPLRTRREDIPALANYFLREICAAQRVPPKTLSRAALSLLAALPWRGNAAELRAVVESIVTGLTGGRGIGLDDVLAHVRLDGGAAAVSNGSTLRQARSRFEREYIASVLEHHHGRISEAAKALGIQRTNLYRKMRSLRVVNERGKQS